MNEPQYPYRELTRALELNQDLPVYAELRQKVEGLLQELEGLRRSQG